MMYLQAKVPMCTPGVKVGALESRNQLVAILN